MLESLYIKDFILISELNIDFYNGFSAFTGETGAGKSILMDAIGLLCGERASIADIRSGCPKAIIEGTFRPERGLKARLAELGFEDDEITVTREFDRDGHNACRINHRIVNAANLKETLAQFVDIHSQRDHQYLLNAHYHAELLDAFAGDQGLLAETRAAYQSLSQLEKALEELKNTTYSDSEAEFLSYQLSEIDKAKLQEGEDQELEERIRALTSKDKIFSVVSEAIDRLDGDEGSLAAIHSAAKGLRTLNESKELLSLSERLENHYLEISDLTESLRSYLDQLEMSEDDLNRLNERLFLLNNLKRKYGGEITDILARREKIRQQLAAIANRDEVIGNKEKELRQARTQYDAAALRLSRARKESAKELERKISRELGDLQLKKAAFSIEIQPKEPSASGSDKIGFLISMNPGEELRPLQKVASGGELSRLMLGLKTIFNRLWGTELIIFDEIDSGVSGAVALAIGRKMQAIAEKSQVFAVTHLAPVAASAGYQYRVEKTVRDEQTFTEIYKLDRSERISELALINTGSTTSNALSSAAELLDEAQKK